MKFVFHKKYKLYIKFFQKIFCYAFDTIMKLFFTIVYKRIISLRWKFDDYPLVEYPLYLFCLYVQYAFNMNASKFQFQLLCNLMLIQYV